MKRWVLKANGFDGWMEKVDAIIQAKVGLSAADLPDVAYRDWYEDAVTPARAAARAVKYAKEGM